MPYETLLLERADRVATLTLNRPQALNALSPQMVEEFHSALEEVEGDASLRALVVRGAGRAFCAGADLTFFETAFDDRPALSAYLTRFNEALHRLEALPLPTIAVVHGFALAGGLEVLLACDLALAAEDARLGDQHINFALMPGGGSTQRLPRRIGMQRALELMLTGRWLSGREAAEWGLVLRAAPPDRLEAEVGALLAALRDKSREALGWIKGAALKGRDLPLREGTAYERWAFVEYCTTSAHPREGLRAFREKRQPKF